MVPTPIDVLKKAKPNAASIIEAFIDLKSILNRKSMPSLAPSRVKATKHMMIINKNKIGMDVLVIFSMPFFTPAIMIMVTNRMAKICQITGAIGLEIVESNMVTIVSLD